MIMTLNSNWTTFDDYYTDLNKKYKRRVKTARKKFNPLTSRELDINEIQVFSKRIHELYLNVSNNAKFNTFLLPESHFHTLKLRLGDRFRVYAYFLEDELVGFYSLIINSDVLETYFLGYDSEHQYSNQMYLNMLYDMIDFGIKYQFKSIVYARTAMEIKSSVGATKVEMYMYMKHTNKIANFIFKQVFNLMNPSQNWVERHPFK
jgi:predicted N-acyltransferase